MILSARTHGSQLNSGGFGFSITVLSPKTPPFTIAAPGKSSPEEEMATMYTWHTEVVILDIITTVIWQPHTIMVQVWVKRAIFGLFSLLIKGLPGLPGAFRKYLLIAQMEGKFQIG